MLCYLYFFAASFCLFLSGTINAANAADGAVIYPLPAIFVSDHALEENEFVMAISSDRAGNDRMYAIDQFSNVFRNHFKDVTATIDSQNKYRTIVAYLQISRVSKYIVKKSDQLQDLYMPMTMTLGFANLMTGEILSTHTFTHYAKYGTTTTAVTVDGTQGQEIVDLYRETFIDLLEKVVASAHANLNLRTIEATVRDSWKGLYILDKGTRAGVVRGDTLTDSQGRSLSIVHAEERFSIGQPILGEPNDEMVFYKYASDDISEIKKPKIILLKNELAKQSQNTKGRDDYIYQMFVNALGKKATFSLLSLDKSFYEIQRAVVETTKLEHKVTQQRVLPDYFLSLYVHGPFFRSLPTNKPDVFIDEYTVRACGDFLDAGGRVVYGKCVEEVIADQIVSEIRFPRSAREEVAIKNALIKLADDFIENVKFTNFTLPVVSSDKENGISMEDKSGAVSNGLVVTSYHSISKVSGIEGEVRLPTETFQVYDVMNAQPRALSLMRVNDKVPPSTVGDVVLLEAILGGDGGPQKKVALCRPSDDQVEAEDIRRLFYYSVSEGIPYPFYEMESLRETLPMFPEYGFKAWPGTFNDDADYCIEPVIRLDANHNGQVVECSLVAGIKVHQGNDVVWKKGMQQDWRFSLPHGSDANFLDSEVCRVMYPLVTDISEKIEIK